MSQTGVSRISSPTGAAASGSTIAELRGDDHFHVEIDCQRAASEAALTAPTKVVALLEANQISAQCLWRIPSC